MEPPAEYAGGLPNLCLQEPLISEAITAGREYPVFPHDADTQRAASTFAVALHMHQPIPAGGDLHARAGHQQPEDGDLPALQPVLQHRVRERFQPGEGPGRLAAVIGELSAEDARFSMDGGSWTNDVSWVRGYGNVLAAMQRDSTLFSEHLPAPGVPASDLNVADMLQRICPQQAATGKK